MLTEQVPCRACGKPVDPLRARAVAILNTGFAYFCDAACKLGFHGQDDTETVAPPAVAVRENGSPRTLAAGAPTRAAAAQVAERERTDGASALGEDFQLLSAQEIAASGAELRDEAAEPVPKVSRADVVSEPGAARVAGDFPQAPAAAAAASASALSGNYLQYACILLALAALVGAALAFVRAAAVVHALLTVLLAGASAFVLSLREFRARAPRHVAAFDAAAPPLLLVAWGAWVAPCALLVLAAAAGFASTPQVAHFVAMCTLSVWLVEAGVALARRSEDALRAARRIEISAACTVERAGVRHRELPGALEVGDLLVLRAGDWCPVDAVAQTGGAEVQLLRAVREVAAVEPGDAIPIFAKLVSGSCTVEVARISVESAGFRTLYGTASPSARARRWAHAYLAAAAALAVCAMLAGFAQGASPEVLVCMFFVPIFALAPHALQRVWALSVASAERIALDHGVVFRDQDAWLSCAQSGAVAFLGRSIFLLGTPSVLALEPVAPRTRQSVLADLAHFGFFFSAAARAQLNAGAAALPSAAVLDHVPEFGARVQTVEGLRMTLGARAYLRSFEIAIGAPDPRESQGELAVLYLAHERRPAAILVLEHSLRPGAALAVAELVRADVEPILFTGEDGDAARALGALLGIDHVRADVELGGESAALDELASARPELVVIGLSGRHVHGLTAGQISMHLACSSLATSGAHVSCSARGAEHAAVALAAAKHVLRRVRTTAAALGSALLVGGVVSLTGFVPVAVLPLLGTLLAAAAVAFGSAPAAWLVRRAVR